MKYLKSLSVTLALAAVATVLVLGFVHEPGAILTAGAVLLLWAAVHDVLYGTKDRSDWS